MRSRGFGADRVCARVSFSACAAQHQAIIQTNFAGETIHIIDPATNKVVREIEGDRSDPRDRGVPDGSRIYISEEANNTLMVIDGKTLKVTKKFR